MRPRTFAGARVHDGILFSSVSTPNKSSAAAIKCASTDTAVVLFAFSGTFGFAVSAFFVPAAVEGAVAVEGADGPGVPWRDGWAETVRSLPCVSTIAAGNSANLVSSAVGSFDLASWKSASTAGVRAVVMLHSY